ncbi:hypothetical protein GQS65_12870 [Halomarina oriensis]|uniref:Uncharacterized protein n=2 Tax=Halomarina oriensis TaxID=671145 RepID=A0A6B0GKB1_9EURY|nr:hypothetical protein [Halomarina oriensis]
MWRLARRFALFWSAGVLALLTLDSVAASNAAVSLNNAAARNALAVPRWLYLSTGGGTIGASALLASFVTDRQYIEYVHNWAVDVHPTRLVRRGGTAVLRFLGVVALGYVIWSGLTGPQIPTVNGAVILVFAGVRAGLTIISYLIGNPWPLVNPWRTLSTVLPTFDIQYPARVGRWPAVGGFLGLIWIETTTPINNQPALLATVLLGYSILTLTGALVFGRDAWFDNVDPISVMFRFYGSVAPIQRSDDGLSIRPPGFGLPAKRIVDSLDDIAFIIALVWELTFTGFVTTAPGAAFVEALVSLGFPVLGVYLTVFIGGYGLFVGVYLAAAKRTRTFVGTYFTSRALALRFAPPLLAIGAGYHLAHYFGFFISLLPSLQAVITSPLTPPANPIVLTLPGWFEGLNIAFVLLGHLLAIWLAHAIAYETFASRLVAIRSQYSFIAVMIGYTVISLWLISLPTATPAFL